MRRFQIMTAVTAATMLFGCGSSASTSAPSSMPLTAFTTGDEAPTATVATGEVDTEAALATFDLSALPPAPWSAQHLASTAVPAQLLAAWANAANRTSCAPIAPAALGAGEGASPRVSDLVEGGWAVEFDRRGMPGMTTSGGTCARCGRGVFGIAGTTMTADSLLTEDDATDVPTPTFADGSHLAVEPPSEGESVAAATLTVRGQGCVYQVWSFLGESHVRELVDQLRIVEVRDTPQVAAR